MTTKLYSINRMIAKFFKKLLGLFQNLSRRKEDVSWKEISGMVRENETKE